jgi:proteasome assembly chaperone (PAC2) family protein
VSYVLHEEGVRFDDPVLLVALEGWIDAGSAGATAASTVREVIGARPLATFDSDRFIDFRARRPQVALRGGVIREVVWPATTLWAGKDGDGRDVLVLSGHEPDANWNEFVSAVTSLATVFGVRMVVGMGAYPAGVPHTRPARVVGTSRDETLALRVGVVNVQLDLPAGIATVIEWQAHEMGIASVALWAQVPHYAAGMTNPGAAVALIDAACDVAGLTIPAEALHAAAITQTEQLNRLIENSQEHVAMIRQLEQSYDDEPPEVVRTDGPLPSGDELAAELERFLRDQGT